MSHPSFLILLPNHPHNLENGLCRAKSVAQTKAEPHQIVPHHNLETVLERDHSLANRDAKAAQRVP